MNVNLLFMVMKSLTDVLRVADGIKRHTRCGRLLIHVTGLEYLLEGDMNHCLTFFQIRLEKPLLQDKISNILKNEDLIWATDFIIFCCTLYKRRCVKKTKVKIYPTGTHYEHTTQELDGWWYHPNYLSAPF